ncbi:hypothetical protein BH10PSE19_BH10PSE19_00070 [soil metagenome]
MIYINSKRLRTYFAYLCGLLFIHASFFSVVAHAHSTNENIHVEIIAPYQEQITDMQNTAKRNVADPHLQAAIQALVSHHLPPQQPPSQQIPASNSKSSHVVIFVSSSMLDASLAQWIEQAHQAEATVVIRGLVNQSLPATKAWVKKILEQTANKKGGIAIDPALFTTYGIKQVPAVLVGNDIQHCDAIDHCTLKPYDVVYGNMSLTTALKLLVKNGENATTEATAGLTKMQAAHVS